MARLSSLIILSILLIAAMLYYYFFQPEAQIQSTQGVAKFSEKKVNSTHVKVSMPPVKPIDISKLKGPRDIQKVGVGQE